jgi:rhodanese-related sulfurtransferase
MKKFFIYSIAFFLFSAFLFTGCIKDSSVDQYELVLDHLKTNNLDVSTMHPTGWAVPAKTLYENLSTYYIIDLRSATDYAAGHIAGAVNSTMSNVVTEAAKAGEKKIMLVCYSGQNAAFALAALKLSGYPNSHFLKWGMSAWNSSLDKWTTNISNRAIEPNRHANWVEYNATSFAANTNFDKTPELLSSEEDAAVILKERVQAVLDEGMKFVTPNDALTTPENYFINNYWSIDNVTQNGNSHLKGAYRILPLSIATGDLKYLNPDKKIVTYCFTGQTSAAVTFYLRVLGYDAYGVQYGVNGLANKNMTSNKWPEGQQNYPVE